MTTSVYTLHDVATVTLNPAIDRTVSVSNLSLGAVNRAELVGDRAGGKGVNVAAALAEQGHRAVALGFLGQDNEAVFTAFFSALGVRDACLRLPGATRTGIKIIDPVRGETTDLNFPGLSPRTTHIAELERQLDTIDARWCVLAGSLPPGVTREFYADATRRLKARGVRVALDTSGEALRAAISAGPDVIKPNVHELAELVGRELANEKAVIVAASELVRAGVGLVVVSRGADGAVFVSADEVVVARPPAIAVRSTVGAGDAMVAGIVAARLRGLSLAESARLATAFSLFALSRAEAGRDARAAVAGFVGRVEVSAR
jgi:1-phosphofructokinase